MKRWLAMIALISAAWAQTGQSAPQVTSVYDQLAPKLEQVRKLQNSDPVKALNLLTAAENSFREGAETLPPVLRTGVSQSLTDAKLALSRHSNADLEARLQLIKGIFGKALYDSYFDALASGKAAQAKAILPKMLGASGLSGITDKAQGLASQALKAADSPTRFDGLRRFFERNFAQGITADLQKARVQSTAPKAYLLAAKAYALYLVIQDSPRAGNMNAQAFVDALGMLSKGDLANFKTDVKSLIAQSQSLLKAASAQVPTAKPVAKVTPSTQTQKPAASTKPAPTATAKPTPAQPKPQPKPQAVIQTPAPTPTPVAQPVASDDSFIKELGAVIPNAGQAKLTATSLSRAGIHSLEDWQKAIHELQGQISEAQTYGPSTEAKQILNQVSTRYQTVVSPLVEAVNPSLAERTSRLLGSAQGAVGLRSSDYGVMTAELTENLLATQNRSLGGFHSFMVGLTQTLLGLPKALLFILASMLAIFPLYLLALTFGGRNVYWRYLGLAFLTLILPIILEGLGYLGSILADPQYGGLSFMGGLSQLSIQHSPLAQLIWILLAFASIALATVGLRGIASQFGLLQSQRNLFQRKNPTLSPTQTSPGLTSTGISQAKVSPGLTSETVVEWDEEF